MAQIISRIFIIFLFTLNINISNVYAQNILEDFEEESPTSLGSVANAPQLYNETVRVISPSKKIFILTNDNRSYSKGDFISLLLGNKLVCRALVAKTTDENVGGIKIVKIYDVNLWNQIVVGKEVLVLKGDDSFYANLGKNPVQEAPKTKVNDEEDLFNSTTFNDDEGDFDDNSKRLIKPDNLVYAGIGMIQGKDVDGETTRYTHFNAAWGYQVADNIWAELGAGMNQITDFPATGLDTRLISFSGKLKLTFSAPFDSYFMPYVGYQIVQPNSPSAGVATPGSTSPTQEELDKELQLVEDMKKSTVIFGATILKRIVPGWFIRADLGNDIVSAGLSLEF